MKKNLLIVLALGFYLFAQSAVNVTFQVNMQNAMVSSNGVHIAGNFQGWDSAASLMTDSNTDGIYEFTASIAENTQLEFKFINGNAWGAAEEAVPADCGVSNGFGGYNRTLDVTTSDVTYGPVCFSACENCLPYNPMLVTFRLNMSEQTVSPDGVFIAGTFNGWDETQTQMSLYEPNHYQVVLALNEGSTVKYKFLNGPDWNNAEVVPLGCGEDDGSGIVNRTYDIGSADETLPLICFSACADCSVDVIEQKDLNLDIYPNPAADSFVILTNEIAPLGYTIFDATGNMVQSEKTTRSGMIRINCSNWPNGIYKVVIPGSASKSILIEK